MTKKKKAVLAFETEVKQGIEVTTVTEASRVIGVSTVTIGKWMKKGILPHIALPTGSRYPTAAGVRKALALNADVTGEG